MKKYNFRQVSFDFIIVKRLYFWHDTAITTRLRKKLGISGYRLATPIQMKKKTRSIIYCKRRGITISEITYVILSHRTLTISAELALFKCSFLCYPGSLWGVPRTENLKIWFLKSFASWFSKIKTCLKSRSRPAFHYRPTADLFGDGGILVCPSMGAVKAVISGWAQSSFIRAPDLSSGNLLPSHGKCVSFLPWFRMIRWLDQRSWFDGNTLARCGIQVVDSTRPPKKNRIERILNEKQSF